MRTPDWKSPCRKIAKNKDRAQAKIGKPEREAESKAVEEEEERDPLLEDISELEADAEVKVKEKSHEKQSLQRQIRTLRQLVRGFEANRTFLEDGFGEQKAENPDGADEDSIRWLIYQGNSHSRQPLRSQARMISIIAMLPGDPQQRWRNPVIHNRFIGVKAGFGKNANGFISG